MHTLGCAKLPDGDDRRTPLHCANFSQPARNKIQHSYHFPPIRLMRSACFYVCGSELRVEGTCGSPSAQPCNVSSGTEFGQSTNFEF